MKPTGCAVSYKFVFAGKDCLFCPLLKHLHSSVEAASHLLWHMTSESFPCSLFSPVNSPCMAHIAPPWQTECWGKESGRQPNNCSGKLGYYMSILKRFDAFERGIFEGFLASAVSLQGHYFVQTTSTLLGKIQSGISMGLFPVLQEHQGSAI